MEEIGLQALFETADFEDGLASYLTGMDEASTVTEDTSSEVEESSASMVDNLSEIGSEVVIGALGATAIALAGITAELWSAVDAAEEAEGAQFRFELALRNSGAGAAWTQQQGEDLAKATMLISGADDEAVLSAEALMLRYDTLNKEMMPEYISLANDMAAMMGTDITRAAQQLARGLSKPESATRLLRLAGVSLTEQEKDQLKSWAKQGKLAEGQEFIMNKLAKAFTGAGEALGQTLAGKKDILGGLFENIQEDIGDKLLPTLEKFAQVIIDFLSAPEIQEVISGIGDMLAELAGNAEEYMPTFIEWMSKAIDAIVDGFGWILDNKEIVLAVLGAIGIAMGVLAVQAAMAFLPMIAIFAAIGVAVGFLAKAWTEDWGGIQTKLTAFWNETLQPILQQIWDWLAINVPIAIQVVSDYWNNVLLPALMIVWGWIQTNVLPLLQQLWNWLATNIPIALQTLSDFWNNILLPAIMAVWNFLSTYVIPIFQLIGIIVIQVLVAAFRGLADIWTTLILPTLQKLWEWLGETLGPFIRDTLVPVLLEMYEVWQDKIYPVLVKVYNFIAESLSVAWEKFTNVLDRIKKTLEDIVKKFEALGVAIPDWLKPGSPTPLEVGLIGINDELDTMKGKLANLWGSTPELNPVFNNRPSLNTGSLTSGSTSNQYIFNIERGATEADILRALQRIEAMG